MSRAERGIGSGRMPYEHAPLRRRRARVATIALDQPETRNALSDQVLDELLAAFAAAKARRRRALRRAHLDAREGLLRRAATSPASPPTCR